MYWQVFPQVRCHSTSAHNTEKSFKFNCTDEEFEYSITIKELQIQRSMLTFPSLMSYKLSTTLKIQALFALYINDPNLPVTDLLKSMLASFQWFVPWFPFALHSKSKLLNAARRPSIYHLYQVNLRVR